MTEEMVQQLYALLPVAGGVLAAVVVIVIVCICVRSKKRGQPEAAAPEIVVPAVSETTVRLSKSQPQQNFYVEYEITYLHSDELIE